MANIALRLPTQNFIGTVTYPTHASAWLPPGWMHLHERPTLLENGVAIPSQTYIAMRHPDGTVAVVHTHFNAKWVGGTPKTYALQAPPQAVVTPSPALSLSETVNEITVSNGYFRFKINKLNFGGLEQLAYDLNGTGLYGSAAAVSGRMGMYAVDERGGVEYRSMWGDTLFRVIESSNVQATFQITGLVENNFGIPPLMQHACWITVTAGSRIIKIRYGLTMIADTRTFRLKELGFRIPLPGSAVKVVMRDEGKKAPQAVTLSSSEADFKQWPLGGAVEEAVTRANLHKLPWLHGSEFLDFNPPEDLPEKIEDYSADDIAAGRPDEFSELSDPMYIMTSNGEGVSLYSELAVVLPTGGETLGNWRDLFQLNPIALTSGSDAVASEVYKPVYGDIAPRDSGNFNALETAFETTWNSFADSEKTEDYGWAVYGLPHHDYWPADARPVHYRLFNLAHYGFYPCWFLLSRGGAFTLLDAARRITNALSSLGMVRYGSELEAGAFKFRWHQPGAFYHGKRLIPWGTTDHGIDSAESDSGTAGHWPDPSALLWSWLIDANHWCKEGYHLWLDNVVITTDGSGREKNCMLPHYLLAFQYTREKRFRDAYQTIAANLITVPITTPGILGPLFNVLWPLQAHSILGTAASANYIRNSRTTLAANLSYDASTTLGLIAGVYELDNDSSLLMPPLQNLNLFTQQQYSDTGQPWDGYGPAPGPIGDYHRNLIWPRYLKCLQSAGITTLTAIADPMGYPISACRSNDQTDTYARGTRVIAAKTDTAGWNLSMVTNPIDAAQQQTIAIRVKNPSAVEILNSAYAFPWTGATRSVSHFPGGEFVNTEKLIAVPSGPAGLYTVNFGTDAIIYQNVTPYHEAAMLHNRTVTTWPFGEEVKYHQKFCRGWLKALRNLQVTITAKGQYPTRVSVTQDGGGPTTVSYLLAGVNASMSFSLGVNTFVFLEIASSVSGYSEMQFDASVAADDVALFGYNKTWVNEIQTALGL